MHGRRRVDDEGATQGFLRAPTRRPALTCARLASLPDRQQQHGLLRNLAVSKTWPCRGSLALRMSRERQPRPGGRENELERSELGSRAAPVRSGSHRRRSRGHRRLRTRRRLGLAQRRQRHVPAAEHGPLRIQLPHGVDGRKTPTLRRRSHRGRSCRHDRLRRRRRLDGAEQRGRDLPGDEIRRRGPGIRPGLARRPASALRGRHHRRREGRPGRIRERRRLDRRRQRRRYISGAEASWWRTWATTRAGGSTRTRASWWT